LTILALAGARMNVAAEPTPPAAQEPEAALVAEESAQEPAPAADTDAPAKLVSEEKPLPANIKPNGPVSEMIKLANSGLDESVMQAFATNSTHTFNLSAEEIIYLNDLGVPGSVVTAMIQRDQQLKGTAPGPLAGEATAPPLPVNEPNPVPPPGSSEFSLSTAPTPPEPMEPNYAVEAPLTPPEEDSQGMFYDSLAPYGTWVDVSGYGRCWQPTVVTVSAGWQPYFDCGHWMYSDCGWYWYSDYSWGWAPFHYGRWFQHSHLGWCWLPGRTWGPSWVSWRYSDHHCGWAPLPPGTHFAAGVGLTFHGHRVAEGDDLGLRPDHYHFVDWNHFNDRNLRHDSLAHRQNVRAYYDSVAVTRISGYNNTIINNGLPVSRVAAATGRPVHTVELREATQPVNGRAERYDAAGHTLAVYRPNPNSPGNYPSRVHQGSHGPAARPGSSQLTPTAAPWTPHAGNPRQSSIEEKPESDPTSHAGTPLVLRGPQSSAQNERVPANSLVVIGRQPSAPSAPSAPSTPSAASATPWASAPSAPSAERAPRADRAIPAERASSAATEAALSSSVVNRPPPQQNSQGNWMGTVSGSPQPAWFYGAGRTATAPGHSYTPASRPEAHSYQQAPRATMEVPRYAPAQSYTPQRSYTPPAQSSPSVQSRPAPSAAPARSAPAPAPANTSQSRRLGLKSG